LLADFKKRYLTLIGIVLNYFRETVLVIAGNILGIDNPWQDTPILYTMLIIDILQFAGSFGKLPYAVQDIIGTCII